MRARRRSIVFAGSGTAGHLYPGLRIAEDLVAARLVGREGVVFCGAARGAGRDAVEAAGFSFRVLAGARPLRGKGITGVAGGAVGLVESALTAQAILRELSPSAVVGIGGYASFPVVLAASFLGLPVAVLQVDATFGFANGAGALLARAIPAAFPATMDTFEKSRLGRAALRRGIEVTLVRPCVRREIEELGTSTPDRAEAKKRLGLDPHRPFVVFVGGSLGAGPLNDAAAEACRRWSGADSPQTLHITGRRYFDEVADRLVEVVKRPSSASAVKVSESLRRGLGSRPDGVLVLRTKPFFALAGFVEKIERLYAAADLVVARAGASTVGELAASGTPAVLMPSSFVPGDHQRPNAFALASRGGAVIAEDPQSALVASIVERLLENPRKLSAMRRAGLEAARAPVSAAEVVARLAGFEPQQIKNSAVEAV